MKGSDHFIIGCSTTAFGLWAANTHGMIALAPQEIVTGIVIAGFASLGPDMDSDSSILHGAALYIFIAGFAVPFMLPALGVDPSSLIGDTLWLRFLHSLFPQFGTSDIFGISLVVIATLLALLPKLAPHRGFTHSILFTAILGIAVTTYFEIAELPIVYGLCFIWGWANHLVLDAFTDAGLPDWAWPFSNPFTEY